MMTTTLATIMIMSVLGVNGGDTRGDGNEDHFECNRQPSPMEGNQARTTLSNHPHVSRLQRTMSPQTRE